MKANINKQWTIQTTCNK